MKIRFANEMDAEELLAIYAQYIETDITFEYVLPTVEEFKERIREFSKMYPYLVVCEENGSAIGYAYAHRAFERAAYGWGAEVSIYLSKEARGKGLGRKLYQLLIEILKLQGIKTVYGVVTSPNPRSERLHEYMGFHLIGVFKSAGYKAGRWCNVSWFEKSIAELEDQPAEIRSVQELEQEKLLSLLKTFE